MPASIKRTRYAPNLPGRVADSLESLEHWMETWREPWVSISGGKDSLVALDLMRRLGKRPPIVWFDSGLEFPQTRRYINGLAKAWNLDLHIYKADPTALDVLVANGTWDRDRQYAHESVSMNEALIDRPAARARADLGVACVYGVRADEAEVRRMYLTHAKGQVTHRGPGGAVTSALISPAWRWSSEEVFAYIAERDLPLNPLYRQQVALGVPEHRARVGIIIDGWSLEQGRWVVARALAPDECRRVEEALPRLAEWR